MFERYTEPARRVIFFARYEASQFGSATIESEHFLLGLLREGEKGLQGLFSGSTSIEAIRRQIEDQVPVREKTSTSIDIPLSDECKRILGNTAEESKDLGQSHIDTRHLLLGILREGNCSAAKILKGLGLELGATRSAVSQIPISPAEVPAYAVDHNGIPRHYPPFPKTPMPAAGVVPDDETAKRIAEAVWIPKVSSGPDDQLEATDATLTSGVWIVSGSHRLNNTTTALAAFIQKEDGKILRLHMEKLDS